MKHALIKPALLLLALALAFTACTEAGKPDPANTAAPNSDSADRSSAPDASATDAPIETLPVNDAGVPVFEVSDFGECAELIARIVPDDGENDLHYAHFNADGSGYEGGPVSFFVSEGKLFLRDPYDALFSSVFVYDLETGEGSRLFDHPCEEDRFAPFAEAGGLIITNNAIFDPVSGESVKAEPVFPSEDIISMYVTDEGVFQLAANGGYYISRLEYDPANLSGSAPKWSSPEAAGSIELKEDPPETLFTAEGAEAGITSIYFSSYMGECPDGARCFKAELSEIPNKQSVQGEHTELLFLKFDSAGNFVRAVSPEKGYDALYGACEAYYLGADGYICIMMGFPDALEVYRIGL